MRQDEFFNSQIDALILQCKDYELERVSSKAMILEAEDKTYKQYVYTIVSEIDHKEKTIKLNSGGRETMTTKRHINDSINQY